MLFETAIHRIDLDLTLGREADLPVHVAVEGIDEQLENLPFVARWNGEGAGCGGGPDARIRRHHADGSWRVRLEADGRWWDRGSDGADVVAEAGAVVLLLFLVGRPAADVAVRGDRALLDRWLAATAFLGDLVASDPRPSAQQQEARMVAAPAYSGARATNPGGGAGSSMRVTSRPRSASRFTYRLSGRRTKASRTPASTSSSDSSSSR